MWIAFGKRIHDLWLESAHGILYSIHRSIYTISIMISTGTSCRMKIKTRLGQSKSYTLYMAENKSA